MSNLTSPITDLLHRTNENVSLLPLNSNVKYEGISNPIKITNFWFNTLYANSMLDILTQDGDNKDIVFHLIGPTRNFEQAVGLPPSLPTVVFVSPYCYLGLRSN